MHPPDVAAPIASSPPANHRVQFYEGDSALADAVADHAAVGFSTGGSVMLIARGSRRRLFLDRIRDRGFAAEVAAGRVVFIDAGEALASFMVGDRPDRERMSTSVRAMVDGARSSVSGSSPGRLQVYGEIVDILCESDRVDAAMELEDTWNELLADDPVDLLCGYAMSNFDQASSGAAFDRVCCAHGVVRPAESWDTEIPNEAAAREIARLQQRARALEEEVTRRRDQESVLRTALWARRIAEASERQAREEAERANKAKGDFLAMMSHELRTPLNAIVGYQNLLQQEVVGPLNQDQHRFLDRLGRGARQLMTLIDQVLNLSRVDAGREEVFLETFDLGEVATEARDMIEPHAVRRRLDLELKLPASPVICRSDPGKIRQILLNLLSNAVKFTARGSVTLTVRSDGGIVRCEVRDTGIGIASGNMATIFDQFVQIDSSLRRDHGGCGLGLTVSRRLAQLLGGDLTVESEAGVGSTFKLIVPAQPAGSEQV